MKLGKYLLGPNDTMENGIYEGNAMALAKAIPDESIDLIFTSPPYYNARKSTQFETYANYLDFIAGALGFCHRVLNRDGIFVLNTSPVIKPRRGRQQESQRFPIPFDCFGIAQDTGFKYIDDIIWVKPGGASNRAIKFAHHRRPVAYKPFPVTEYLFVFRRTDAPLIDKAIMKHTREEIESSLVPDGYERTNVWKLNPVRSWHDSPFPIGLAERVVRYYSFVGDVVFDPFVGSGTVPLACGKLCRRYLAFDVNPVAVTRARRRMADAQLSMFDL